MMPTRYLVSGEIDFKTLVSDDKVNNQVKFVNFRTGIKRRKWSRPWEPLWLINTEPYQPPSRPMTSQTTWDSSSRNWDSDNY